MVCCGKSLKRSALTEAYTNSCESGKTTEAPMRAALLLCLKAVNYGWWLHSSCRSATRPLATYRGCGPPSNASHLAPEPTAFVRRPLCVSVYCKTLATAKLLLSCTHTSRNYLPPSFSRSAHNATNRPATAHEHVLRTMHNHFAHCHDYDSQLCPGKISLK